MKRPNDRPSDGDVGSTKRQRLTLGGLGASSFLKLATPGISSIFFPAHSSVTARLSGLQSHSTLKKVDSRPREVGHVRSFIVTGVIDALGKNKVSTAFSGGTTDREVQRVESIAPVEGEIGFGDGIDGLGKTSEGSGTAISASSRVQKTTKRIRRLFAEFPIVLWALKWREIFLREVLRLEGRSEVLRLGHCPGPGCKSKKPPEYRCVDCRGADLCETCTMKWHRYNPLHQLQRYNGDFYESAHLGKMGMRIQLMHPPGEVCKFRASHQVENFKIIHTNGVHELPLDFCLCDKGEKVPPNIQLMRSRYWPATCEKPRSATTYEACDQFTRLSLLGRLNIYDYSRALEAATDGAMLRGIASVRQQLSTCVRQFRHITMFKRAGRGHEEGGIGLTQPGGCAVRCPACPDFDMNVPSDWTQKPFRWLYGVILSLDANFRLSNKLTRSTNRTDPNLTDGKAYMAPRKDYNIYLKQNEGEIMDLQSDCSRFGALHMANQKGGHKGLRTTGIAGCFCARHEFVQPLGMAPLYRGERYVTMDWVFCGALAFIRAAQLTVCYDIACQWSKKLVARISRIRSTRSVWKGAETFLSFASAGAVNYAVPKFHLYAHRVYCQLRYALGWLLGTGFTDGEGCERVWAGANPAASSLREMGPGGMSDTMDDMCGSWNWQKICGLGPLLVSHMQRALHEGAVQTAIFTEFTEAVEREDSSKLAKTRAQLAAWDRDEVKKQGASCPYFIEKETLTIAQIRLQTETAQGTATGQAATHHAEDDAALAQMLLRGLAIEDDRDRFSARLKDDNTVIQQTTRIQTQNSVVRAIVSFRQDQEYCMPHVYGVLTADEREPNRTTAMSTKLYMPSDPPDGDRSLISPAACEMESRVRWASMTDALDDLRHQLRLKGVLNKFKLANITGQRANTRARSAQDAVAANVKKAATCYRRHRAAYMALQGPGKWEKTMRPLADTDCRGLGDRLLEQLEHKSEHSVRTFLATGRGIFSSGESHYKLPWIWYNSTEESSVKVTDELMVEWCKCRARAQHWVEEIRLLAEEMRRVIAFNESMIAIWERRRDPGVTVDVGEEHQYASDEGWADGVRAYACKQASIRRQQIAKWREDFADSWRAAEKFLALHTPEGFSIEPLIFLTSEELMSPTRGADPSPRPSYSTPEGYQDDDDDDYISADVVEEGWGEEVEGDWEENSDDGSEAANATANADRRGGTGALLHAASHSTESEREMKKPQLRKRKQGPAAKAHTRRPRTATKGPHKKTGSKKS